MQRDIEDRVNKIEQTLDKITASLITLEQKISCQNYASVGGFNKCAHQWKTHFEGAAHYQYCTKCDMRIAAP